MTSVTTAGAASAPETAHDSVVLAMLELRTEWHFWGFIEHEDKRLFAGRIGEVRLFGTTMSRIDMPIGGQTFICGIAGALVAGWLKTSEDVARSWANLIGLPERRLLSLSDVRNSIANAGGIDGRQ